MQSYRAENSSKISENPSVLVSFTRMYHGVGPGPTVTALSCVMDQGAVLTPQAFWISCYKDTGTETLWPLTQHGPKKEEMWG